MNTDLFHQLRQHSFLTGMPDDSVRLIADCAEPKDFQSEELLMVQNRSADVFYLLFGGQVSLRLHAPQGPIPIETVSAPAALGWSWLVPPYKWQYDALAISTTKTLMIHTPCILGKVAADKSFGCDMYQRFIEVVVDRLHGTQIQMMDVYAAPEISEL